MDDGPRNVYVLKRPGVDDFLIKMGKIYEVAIFTASLSKVQNYNFSMLILLLIYWIVRKLVPTGYIEIIVQL